MVGIGTDRMEYKEELFLKQIMYGYPQTELTTLIQEDASIIFGIMFGDVLKEEPSKPCNRGNF
jgi:hypothetical protein